MTILPDLFSFAYVPGWYCQLDELAGLARPEPWRFREPIYSTKNQDTPILERYIHAIFKKQAIDFNEEKNPEKAAQYFHMENEYACFHTGLYTARYKAIYGCFDRNKRQASMLDWYFRGFADEMSPWLKYVSPLPARPSYDMAQQGVNFNPEWPIRVNVDHTWSLLWRRSSPAKCRRCGRPQGSSIHIARMRQGRSCSRNCRRWRTGMRHSAKCTNRKWRGFRRSRLRIGTGGHSLTKRKSSENGWKIISD